MTVYVTKDYIEAGRKTAEQLEARLRQRFHDAYGVEEGDRIVDEMMERMQANMLSDSKDPNAEMEDERVPAFA